MFRFSSGVLVALVTSSPVLACGPDFPFEFLSDRDRTIAQLPDSLFMLEAGRLVSRPAHPLPVVEGEEPQSAREGGGARERALYGEGAALWKAGQRHAARAKFLQLLALPEADRRWFTVMASYDVALVSDVDEARTKFQALRALVEQGWADPLGLAVASLGEEAHLALERGEDAKAVALYALQASHGSQGGRVSLLYVARQLTGDEARLSKALNDPLVQRLMATYLWTRSTESWWTERTHGLGAEEVLAKLLQLPQVSGADHLAAALFRAGRFEEAQRLVEKEQSPIAHWVKAKLLMRRGDRLAADHELELAASGYSMNEQWGVPYQPDYRPRQQLELERAIIALSRDDFEGAMRYARASCSWQDQAYLAERVLDVDTVKRLLDAPQPSPDPCELLRPEQVEDSSTGWLPPKPGEALRSVLARRLMRLGRGREALAYFPEGLRPKAEQYVRSLEQGKAGRTALERARALAEAAVLARTEGLELLGLEGEPDFRWTDGAFDPGASLHDAGVTAEEWRRWNASAPRFSTRFQYRAEASRLAEASANELSPRSQAFTVMLCRAAGYVRRDDEARFQALWSRAVKEGPLLREPMVFGQECPQPRFVDPPAPRRKALRKRALVVPAALTMVVALAVWGLRRRFKTSP